MFSLTSRYYGIATVIVELPDGRKVTCVGRRFVPRPEDLTQIGEHVVRSGERADLVAYQAYGDAEQSWRIADGNRGMDPDELMQPGRRLRITLSAGIPAAGLLSPAGGGSGAS
jgi:hypothetical protein